MPGDRQRDSDQAIRRHLRGDARAQCQRPIVQCRVGERAGAVVHRQVIRLTRGQVGEDVEQRTLERGLADHGCAVVETWQGGGLDDGILPHDGLELPRSAVPTANRLP